MDLWRRIAEEKIEEAMAEGAFDNLPGAGKPLPVDEDALVEPEMRLAYHLLRSNGFAPRWIEERREIEATIQSARASLARSWEWYRSGRRDVWTEGEWRRAVEAFRRQVVRINQRIADYNLITPSSRTQRQLVDVNQEIGRVVAEAGD
jgi:DnaJ family protein C protein 28